jgi:transposase
MPEHVLMSEIEIITDGGRRRRWSASEKMSAVSASSSGRPRGAFLWVERCWPRTRQANRSDTRNFCMT